VPAGVATAEAWGGDLVAAVDGTRFVVPVRSIHARPNPKYFGRWLDRQGSRRRHRHRGPTAG